uniref:Sulfotransferase n=1 Tax=Leptobrachium leishanense TaxID=445787 RepID=A0A8C5QPM1_9ANUR
MFCLFAGYTNLRSDMTAPEIHDSTKCNLGDTRYFSNVYKKEHIDYLLNFKIRDDDVFVVTYPKSGTIWTQHILSLIYSKGYRNGTENVTSENIVQCLELNRLNNDPAARPSPRLFTTHLPYSLVPQDLTKKGKVIYVTRNPKDVMTSMYHFIDLVSFKMKPNFETFMEIFLAGHYYPCLWFDHVREWYNNKKDLNILYITYEDMILDLRSVVKQICTFLGRELDDTSLDIVAEKATFKEMTKDTRANKNSISDTYSFFDSSKGKFMRKGTIGDWKNEMTVRQSERFDALFMEQMRDLQINLIWDIPEKLTC